MNNHNILVVVLDRISISNLTKMAKTILITGANRGVGLEFVRQFLKLDQPPQVIIAICRDPEKATVSILTILLDLMK